MRDVAAREFERCARMRAAWERNAFWRKLLPSIDLVGSEKGDHPESNALLKSVGSVRTTPGGHLIDCMQQSRHRLEQASC